MKAYKSPYHARHFSFARAKGLAIKVSDEFVVPLCVLHHNELHIMANEYAFWRKYSIDPLKAAATLWQATLEQ